MSGLVDMHGRPIGSHNQNQKQRPITKAQAGAILTSELDMAVEMWNKKAREQFPDDETKAHIFTLNFDKFEYSSEAKEKSGLFGYAKLSISFTHEGKTIEVYNKGRNFTKEKELDNTNAYYPDMAIDCISFLLASGLMYNLAMNNQATNAKQPKNSKVKLNKSGTTTEG